VLVDTLIEVDVGRVVLVEVAAGAEVGVEVVVTTY